MLCHRTTPILATLLLTFAALARTDAAAQQFTSDRFTKVPDILFADVDGSKRWGVRCGSPEPSPGELDLTLVDVLGSVPERAHEKRRPVEIPVVFHAIMRRTSGVNEGDVSDVRIAEQIDVLNEAFRGSGFSFRLTHVDRDLPQVLRPLRNS